MSLILDALKKIELDKRRAAEGGAGELVSVSSSRFSGRSNWLSMGAMAIGSALLTAAVVSFLNSREQGPTSAGEGSSAAVAVHGEVPEPVAPEPQTPQLAFPATPVAENKSERTPTLERSMKPAPEADAETDNESADAREADVDEAGASAEVVESAESAPEAPADAPPPDGGENFSQPIRLVGQERILLDALNLGQSSESSDDVSEDSELPPEDFPTLVLQGTSVIGGNAVAVISDHRVFEGDRIEGAVVVRIGEREVELEVDGKRFRLRM